jgi:acetyl-CoA synthetase
MANDSIENLSTENRTFSPSPEFTAQANAQADLYLEADKDRLAFWEEQAKALVWEKRG